MRTNKVVWGAALVASGLLPVVSAMWGTLPPPKKEEDVPRSAVPSVRRKGTARAPEASAPGALPEAVELGVPRHPCQLITVVQVPCEAGADACEVTWWECPRDAKVPRA